MPIYAFQCADCGHAFDHLQRLSDADPTVCPACGAESLRRQVTAPSFRLAGGGWYETDFKKDGDRKRNLVEGSSGGTGSTPPTESKPAATPAAAPAATPAAPAAAAKPAGKPASD